MTSTPTIPRPPARNHQPLPTATERLARARELDDEIRRLHRRSNADNARIAKHLLELQTTGGHLALEFASINAYSRQRLGWGNKKTEELLRLVLRLQKLPVMRASFEAGELDWTKAVVAARAATEEPEKEQEWTESGKDLPVDELKRKACDAMGEEPRVRLTFDFSLEQAAIILQGDRGLRSEGLRLTREERVVEAYLRMLQGGAVGSSKFRALLVHEPSSGETAVPTPDGDVTLSPGLVGRILCGAEVQEERDGKEIVTKQIPEQVRRRVERRSKGICEMPTCRHDASECHHLHGRKNHDADEILNLCAAHHTSFHQGLHRARGSWKTGIEITLADGTPRGRLGGAPARSLAADSGARAPVEGPPADDGARAPSHDPMRERRDALLALRALEFGSREARRRLDRALELHPALCAAPAGDLVRAALGV